MDTWWCYRCDFTWECLGASEVRCPKGHKMKKYTARELEFARAAEGISA